MKEMRRWLAAMLCVLMLAGMLPASLAEEGEPSPAAAEMEAVSAPEAVEEESLPSTAPRCDEPPPPPPEPKEVW